MASNSLDGGVDGVAGLAEEEQEFESAVLGAPEAAEAPRPKSFEGLGLAEPASSELTVSPVGPTAIVMGTILVASWVAPAILTAVLAAIAALGAIQMSQSVGSPGPFKRLVIASGAAAFPLTAFFLGEAGLLWSTGGVFIVLAGLGLVSSEERSLALVAYSLWAAIYAGFLVSYPSLIRQAGPGKALLTFLLIMVCSFKLASTKVASLPGRGASGARAARGRFMGWPGCLAGVAAVIAAGLASLLFFDEPFTSGPVLVLGAVVGVASVLGDTAGRLVRSEVNLPSGPGKLSIIQALEPLLFAAPAFFYSSRLYLN